MSTETSSWRMCSSMRWVPAESETLECQGRSVNSTRTRSRKREPPNFLRQAMCPSIGLSPLLSLAQRGPPAAFILSLRVTTMMEHAIATRLPRLIPPVPLRYSNPGRFRMHPPSFFYLNYLGPCCPTLHRIYGLWAYCCTVSLQDVYLFSILSNQGSR